MANRNQTLYDVAIVGTGPSGSLLAHEFATAGWAVLLLEKKHLPRYKTCGGGLTQRALQLIPFDIQEVIEDQAHTTRLRVHYQTAFSQTRHLPAVRLVMRDRLDHLLAQHAVGADGAYSRVARALNLPIHYRVMPALEAELTVPPVCPIAALPDPFILTSASFREAMPGFFPKKTTFQPAFWPAAARQNS